jgi:peptide chain release factor 2
MKFLWLYVKQVEEAQLIKQLAESNAIDYGLYKQAYDASIDVSNILDKYEISKLLKGPFDMAGACLVIKAAPSTSIYPKVSYIIFKLYYNYV